MESLTETEYNAVIEDMTEIYPPIIEQLVAIADKHNFDRDDISYGAHRQCAPNFGTLSQAGASHSAHRCKSDCSDRGNMTFAFSNEPIQTFRKTCVR